MGSSSSNLNSAGYAPVYMYRGCVMETWDVIVTDRMLEAGDVLTRYMGLILGPAALAELFRIMWCELDQSPRSPHPQIIPPEPDLTLSNMITRCESLLNAARELVFANLSTQYETVDGDLELAVSIGLRSRRGSQHTSSSERAQGAQ